MRIYLNARILPAFGRMALDALGPEDVAAWFDAASRDKPGAANRALEILRAMMFRAEEWGLRDRGTNPCLGIARNPRNKVARFLDADELARLGRALDAREARWPEAVAAIRLLALTGCRRSEVLDLRWRNIGDDALNLEDSKTGPPHGPARRVRAGAHRGVARSPRPGRVPVSAPCRRPGHLGSHELLARGLRRCRTRQAAPPRPAATRRQPGGHGGREPALVGKILGHRRHRTTAGYAHLADEHLVEAAETVGGIIARAMGGRTGPPLLPDAPDGPGGGEGCGRPGAPPRGGVAI